MLLGIVAVGYPRKKTQWGSRIGAVVRALAFHQCVPGSISRLGIISGLSLLVLYSASRGFSKSTQIKSYLIKCWFLMKGENRSTRRKTSRSIEENQQTQPTYGIESGNRSRATLVEGKCSHHCANPAPLKQKEIN